MGNKALRRPPAKDLQETSPDLGSQSTSATGPAIPGDSRFDAGFNNNQGLKFKDVYRRTTGTFLDEGHFGVVYRCEHIMADPDDEWKFCALKVTSPNLLDRRRGKMTTPNEVETKCQELRCLLQLRGVPYNKHILQIQEYFYNRDSGELRLVTELLGPNLREWITEESVFTENQGRQVARSLTKALLFMHSRGVVHRDIKSDNVMFQRADDLRSLKIVDFGFAREIGKGETVQEFCGSPGYIPPEIYTKDSYGFEPDMFSLGVLLFRLISSEQPWPSYPEAAAKRATIQLQYRITSEKWKKVSPNGKDLVQKLLTYKEDRLTPAEASYHRWMTEDTETILRREKPPMIVPTKALSLSLSTASSSVSSFATMGNTRFWIDRTKHLALQNVPLSVYKARIVTSEHDQFLMDESLSDSETTLDQYISALPLYSELECRSLCKEIVRRVRALHKAGLAHRNLNIDSIVVENQTQSQPVLGLRGMQYAMKIQKDEPMTGRVGVHGKHRKHFPYVSPEIDTCFYHDERVDLWSLGVIMYTLLCGVPPFRSREVRDTAKFEFDLVRPSREARSLVKRLLTTNPAKRPSLDQILEDAWMYKDNLESNSLTLTKDIFADYGRRVGDSTIFRRQPK